MDGSRIHVRGRIRRRIAEDHARREEVELAAASEETKMLSMKMDNLDPDGGNIVQAVHAKMLKSLAAEMAEAKVVEDPATE